MPYSITCSTEILTLSLAAFLFVLVGVLCEFAMVQVCTLYCPIRNKRCTLPTEGTDVQVQHHIHQKDLNLCLPLCYHGKVIV